MVYVANVEKIGHVFIINKIDSLVHNKDIIIIIHKKLFSNTYKNDTRVLQEKTFTHTNLFNSHTLSELSFFGFVSLVSKWEH